MFEIKGKVSTAICFANVVEEEAIEQIRRMCDYGFTRGSRIRIMPDVHAGKGCTIGTTMTIVDKVVPNIVGVDIGCGMYTVELGKAEVDFVKLDEAAHFVPSGMNIWKCCQEAFDFNELRCYKSLKNIDWLEKSLGTLGSGNHFIEVEEAADGTKYLIIHTGSRNLGKQVAEIYQKLAVELNKNNASQSGSESENESENVPADLCYLYGKHFEDYLHDVGICQRFARRNREKIAEVLLSRTGMSGTGGESFHTIHNYIDTEEMILRKGAIAAHKGEKVLIPINMKDGSVLAIGKGNPEWNYSAPHGAGRLMSRTRAKSTFSLAEYQTMMQGIYTTCVNEATLDEAPMVYKSLKDIVEEIKDTVDIIEVMKPIYNFKAN